MPAKTTKEKQARADRIRATALDLAIKAAPYLLPTALDRVRGAQLTAEAEHIEKWLKEAKP